MWRLILTPVSPSAILEVNLSVWDFPRKNTLVARRKLVLSQENHFMDQASVTVGDRPR